MNLGLSLIVMPSYTTETEILIIETNLLNKINENMLKAREITIQTPRGERKLTFVQSPKAKAELEVCCEEVCPYGNLCEKIRDPRNPEDPNSSLETLCCELGLGDGDDESLQQFFPAPGTIEKNLPDFPDIFQQLTEKNPMVALKDVITNVCSKFCDEFEPGCSNCNSKNLSCMLHDLFKAKNIEAIEYQVVDESEFKKPEPTDEEEGEVAP